MLLILIKQFIKLLSSPLPKKQLFIDLIDSPCYQQDTSNDPYHTNFKLFLEKAKELGDCRILEVGSRNSLVKSHFNMGKYTGFDIRSGEAVDVVGDVHHLSQNLKHDYYDIVLSISAFEHFAMPWKAVLEINTVMKIGGLLFVATHPTWPAHDLPWDFWRYSKEAFKVLLNQKTGFKILHCSEGIPASIIPFGYEPSIINLHKQPTHLGISVIAKKIGPSASNLTWNMSVKEVLDTNYPV